VLDLFDKLEYPPDKTMIVLNKVYDERQGKNATLPVERIQNFLKRSIVATIPFVDERIILTAIVKAVPVIAVDRDTSKAPIRQLLDLADHMHRALAPAKDDDKVDGKSADKNKPRSGLSLRLGR
jgi:septum formation inhibitor-activating ATPase MinD